MPHTDLDERRTYHRQYRAEHREQKNEYQRRWRSKNPDYNKQWAAQNPGAKRSIMLRWIRTRALAMAWYKQSQGCADCGETDPVVLDFDHVRVRGHKQFTIAQNSRCSLATLWSEIQKCDVVCANCHRRRTVNRHKNSFVKSLLKPRK